MEWSAVVLTCPNSNYTSAYQKELERRSNNFLSRETTLIVVEDPKSQIGSGGATLNALLVLAEHISAKKGFSVINSDVLENGRILLIHSGRIMPYEPCGRPFISLALTLGDENPQPLCILDLIINLMSTKNPSGEATWLVDSPQCLISCETMTWFSVDKPVLINAGVMVKSMSTYRKAKVIRGLSVWHFINDEHFYDKNPGPFKLGCQLCL